MTFNLPPVLLNKEGKPRKVGFEMEYANVTVEESVRVILDLFGGTVKKTNRFKQEVVDTALGNFTVEFDLTLLTEKTYKKLLEPFNIKLEEIKVGAGTLEDEFEVALEGIIGKIFPNEIACPPVEITRLEELERLRDALHQNKAEGTESFITNAFGTHINVEVPATDETTLLNYLRAFLLLYPWLLQAGKTDFARKVSPFIDPFPDEYTQKVLSHSYKPDLETFIRDYNCFNPDRNRPLDMYPLFSCLNKELTSQFTGMGKVKPRTTFHYRLPNSSIALPDWTLAKEWNNWVQIEKLAASPKDIFKLSDAYLVMKTNTLIGFENKWVAKINECLSKA